MEQKLKQQLGEMLFTILALQFKLEEKDKELGECRALNSNNNKPTRK